jgi:hypothetical protein
MLEMHIAALDIGSTSADSIILQIDWVVVVETWNPEKTSSSSLKSS